MARDDATGAAYLPRCARHGLQVGNLHLAHACCTAGLARCATARPALRAYGHCVLIDILYHAGRSTEAEGVLQGITESGDVHQLPQQWRVQLLLRGLGLAIAAQQFRETRVRLHTVQTYVPLHMPTPVALQIENLAIRLDYREALSQNPDAIGTVLTLAEQRYRRTVQQEETLPTANRMLIRNNDLGAVLVSMGRHTEAIPLLEELLQRHAAARDLFGRVQSALILAHAYRSHKQYPAAEG